MFLQLCKPNHYSTLLGNSYPGSTLRAAKRVPRQYNLTQLLADTLQVVISIPLQANNIYRIALTFVFVCLSYRVRHQVILQDPTKHIQEGIIYILRHHLAQQMIVLYLTRQHINLQVSVLTSLIFS